MKNFSDKSIKAAFAEIRASFEKRNNDYGLEILDHYEEQWAVTGSLSDRQIAWMVKQLDGSWCRSERKPMNGSGPQIASRSHEGDFSQIPAQGVGQLFDVVVRQKLAEEGKALVDLARLNELERAIDGVRELLKSLR